MAITFILKAATSWKRVTVHPLFFRIIPGGRSIWVKNIELVKSKFSIDLTVVVTI